ncbi:MAG TPA: AMP-binding protein [Anaeromyxobacteraceae bacterium]|nr:AMP-binding protein [Anaeromyxobacteraceae bacterium]
MHPLFPRLDRLPSRPAIRIGEATLTYGQLALAARRHAGGLFADGVRRGDRVAVWATPGLPTLVALVGNALLGAPTVPLNPAIGERELAHVLTDSAPRLVLAAEPAAFGARTPGVRGLYGAGPSKHPEAADADDPLLVLYTSGTTGAPKGAVISHRNAAFDLDALAEAWGWTEDDTLVHALPLFHVHGLVLGVLGSVRIGSRLNLLPRFSPEALCAAMGAGGTMAFGVPTMYHRLVEHAESNPGDARRFASARLVVSGSAALPLREHERLARLLGQRVVERYGLTETLINCAARHDGPRTPGTVGPPLPGVSLRLADEDGRPMVQRPDELGEVTVKGPNVFAGYLNRPEATAAAMDAAGYFHTGDIAHLTPEGEVRLVGRRATDLIKTGGYKVGAGEIEAALLEHPKVREAAVVGRPDDDLGERIVAFVVLNPGSEVRGEELSDHVARLLAPHKRPREVKLLESLPRNAMGKVLKRALASTP